MPPVILIADDDEDNRIIAGEILRTRDFIVREAADGSEALAYLKDAVPDLVFLDLSMPRVSGWDVVAAIREDPAMEKLPVIAFTAHASHDDQKKALASGCDDFLSKPCRPSTILACTEKWLSKRPEDKS